MKCPHQPLSRRNQSIMNKLLSAYKNEKRVFIVPNSHEGNYWEGSSAQKIPDYTEREERKCWFCFPPNTPQKWIFVCVHSIFVLYRVYLKISRSPQYLENLKGLLSVKTFQIEHLFLTTSVEHHRWSLPLTPHKHLDDPKRTSEPN